MKKFTLDIFRFCLPLVPLCLFIFCIDPYNYFNVSKLISDETKFVAVNRSPEVMPRGNMLWNMLKYSRKPCPNVIIGNSQGFLIREKLISELTGEEYYNFCVPGVTLKTSISTFWYIIKQAKPEKVFLHIAFAASNSRESRAHNLFQIAQDYINKPYLYFLNKDILFDSYNNLKYEIEKKKDSPDETSLLKTVNGKNNQDELRLTNLFNNYSYPEKDIDELKKISAYCKNNNIKLEFIFLPSYRRFDDFLVEKGLIEMRDRFHNDISMLGKIHDYSGAKSINNYEYNFSDYFHPNQYIIDSLTTVIWGSKEDSNSRNSE